MRKLYYLFILSFLLAPTANAQNIGVGTSAPASKLEVRGTTDDDTQSALNITNNSATSLAFVRNDGFVGIGKVVPETDLLEGFQRLEVAGDVIIGGGSANFDGNAEFLRLIAQNRDWYVGVSNATAATSNFFIGLNQNPSTFIITPSGNVGIGTVSPPERLTVFGTTASVQYNIIGSDNNYFQLLSAFNVSGSVPAPDQHVHFMADYNKQSPASDVKLHHGFNSEIRQYQWYSLWSGTNTLLMEVDADTGYLRIEGDFRPGANPGVTGQVLTSQGVGVPPIWTNVAGGVTYNAGTGISISNDTIYNTGDASNTNELQNLTLSNDTLYIDNGNFVTLPPSTDDQNLTFSNDTLYIEDGNFVTLPQSTDDQNLTLSNDTLYIEDGNFVLLDPDQDWEVVGNDMYSIPSNNVGVGITTPIAKMHIVGDAGLLAEGTFGTNSVPTSGTGTRMMWAPTKGAFRTGGVVGNSWDADSVGNYSFATGFDTKAIGSESVAMGSSTRASGTQSTALGNSTTASGPVSTALGSLTTASGHQSLAGGYESSASGSESVAIGDSVTASARAAVAFGVNTVASGTQALAVGSSATASGPTSVALGAETTASGHQAFAAGYQSTASGNESLAIGEGTTASEKTSVALGFQTTASGTNAVALGNNTTASATDAVALGNTTLASGANATAMGFGTVASASWSTAFGFQDTASGQISFAAGFQSASTGNASTAIGFQARALADVAVAIGNIPQALQPWAVAIGNEVTADGESAVAMGYQTNATANNATALGLGSTASGLRSLATGSQTTASGFTATALGFNSIASGDRTTAMGFQTTASGEEATSMGSESVASGDWATATGLQTTASGDAAFTAGDSTIAQAYNSFVIGRHNEITGSANAWVPTDPLFVIGNGSSAISLANAVTVLKNGNMGLGISAPAEKLEIDGTAEMTGFRLTTTPTNGYVLTCDAAGNGSWQPASGSGGPDNDWTLTGNDMYSTPSGNVGIGVTSPNAKLHVVGNNGVLAEGSFGSGLIPTTGLGTRMMWYPGQAAFRAGYVDGVNWDADSTGTYSFAGGYDTKALGNSSTAFGREAAATGFSSTSLGQQTTASGFVSTALGNGSTASGDISTALGFQTNATGGFSTAIGDRNLASGEVSLAMGTQTTASGINSVAIGDSTTASGYGSTALGFQTTASGNIGTTFGDRTAATGEVTTALGAFTTAQAYLSVVLGRYNEVAGATTSWVNTDPLFVVGNGLDAFNRSNALTVLKNGNTGINTSTPGRPLTVQTSANTFGIQHTDGTVTLSTYMENNGSVDGGWIGTESNHDFHLYTNNQTANPALSVTPTNNVGINETAPQFPLHVSGLGRFEQTGNSNALYASNSSLGFPTVAIQNTNTQGWCIYSVGINRFENTVDGNALWATSDGATNPSVYIENLDVSGVSLSVNGTAEKPGGGSWAIPSDRRLKKNIQDFNSGLNIISQIRPISFNYNGKLGYSDEPTYIGIVAQELQEVAPDMVTQFQGKDGNEYLRVDPSAFNFMLINAVQEQQQMIEELQTQNELLQSKMNKINELESMIQELQAASTK